jgi:glycosyltransferase involved in cell wall biosynthesis
LFEELNRLRIIYLHQYFNTPAMAGGTRSYEIGRRLAAAGHEVHMITSWRESDGRRGWFSTAEAGMQVHWLPVPYSNRMSYPERIRAFIRFALGAARRAASLEGDLVFATSTPLTIALPAVYAARRRRIPMVFEVRDLWPELPIAIGALRNPLARWAARRLERWAYRNSEAVIALSPGMRDGVRRAGYPPERIAVVPNGSDNDLFRPDANAGAAFRAARDWLGGRPLLIYAGTFGRINDVGWLIGIAARLQGIAPEIRILLLGDGQEWERVRERALTEGVLDKNLYMERSRPKAEMPAVLAAADMAASLFVDLPEMRANSANKFFDALAAGTPLLLNYGGWQAGLIRDAQAGIVAWGLPGEQAAREIARVMNDTAWLRLAGRNARTLAERLFDRDLLAARLEQVLVAAVSRNGARAQALAPGDFSMDAESPVTGKDQGHG